MGENVGKLISVIVPVYNKAPFLERCIESLVHLKKHEFVEAIFVDDCSTDDSLEIIKKYAAEYEMIQYVELSENTGGPAEPRNEGMKHAQGEYLTFLDADDWLDHDHFIEFVERVHAEGSDIGFGRTFKHTDKQVTQVARFQSFENRSGLVPYEIEKVFRAVGPPGKIFKKTLVETHNIRLKHLKYGEDKLFFTELIAKAATATMTTLPVYHVNRYSQNVSLVKTTTPFEKAKINYDLLKAVIALNIPEVAKTNAISRFMELDFMSRFFFTKIFLRSQDKAAYYSLFEKVCETIESTHVDMDALFTIEKYRVAYALFKKGDREALEQFVKSIFEDAQFPRFIENNIVYQETGLTSITPLKVLCYPVYQGTQIIEGQKYEVIDVLKPEAISVRGVRAVEVRNELNETTLPFEMKGCQLLIPTEALQFQTEAPFNIAVDYSKYDTALVFASYPSTQTENVMKRKSFKVEFEPEDTTKIGDKRYFKTAPQSVLAIKKIKLYEDVDFTQKVADVELCTLLNIQGLVYSSNETPRLQTEEGLILTANIEFVEPLLSVDTNTYMTQIPKRVEITKGCKLYTDRSFKNDPIRSVKVGETFDIETIIYTSNHTPRLKTHQGEYLTANKKFVKEISL